jgi:hypothetical protein
VTAKRTNLRLVIDTNIARSVSESTNPTSINCRKFLETVRDLKFRVVVTPELLEEWKRHRSRVFNRWLTAMFARKLGTRLESVENQALREKIEKYGTSEKNIKEMLKDVLLLEAALATDETIASMNDIDRKRFAVITQHIIEIQAIIWVNPDIPDEKCLEWLEAGAPADDFRMLGYVQADDE